MTAQHDLPESACSVFVYGTLKRGQCRETCWPAAPVDVRPAQVQGLLYDLGAYPALRNGEGRVAGELWEFAPEHMPRVLEVLDMVEGYADSPSDLYRRVQVEVRCGEGRVTAWTYVLCEEPPSSSRILAEPAEWPLREDDTP
ncbi:MAG: gamma-glutamylcyclotransferase [Phycisphaerales bacterium]|nr:gamma-glutamylcyclotransferase [Phycisphaerales bacterium]